MLRATEKRNVSRRLVSFSLNSLRMANPGMNDRKTKTMISLKIGMSNKIVIFARKVIIGITIMIFLMFSVNSMSICFSLSEPIL
jgi:hypothetical protein